MKKAIVIIAVTCSSVLYGMQVPNTELRHRYILQKMFPDFFPIAPTDAIGTITAYYSRKDQTTRALVTYNDQNHKHCKYIQNYTQNDDLDYPREITDYNKKGQGTVHIRMCAKPNDIFFPRVLIEGNEAPIIYLENAPHTPYKKMLDGNVKAQPTKNKKLF